jgi:hypothetical protein
MKTIIIRLGAGSIQDGFNNVNVELKSGNITQWEDRTNLPPNPELQQLLNQWQVLYPAAIQLLSPTLNLSPVFDDDTITNVSSQDMGELNHHFKVGINDWLNFGDFARIDRRLRTDLNIRDRILTIIISEQLKIWQLPWHFWDFLNDYANAVEVFAKPRFSNVSQIEPQPNGKVNILALSGRDPGSNLDLSFLKTLPQSNPTSIEAVSAYEVAAKLQEVQPDIFIFYGHGDTIEGQSIRDGVIYLDNDTPLEISKLRIEIQSAIDRGLQIAIFNCCNGLGLAEQVTDLNIPYIIVMREIIPNLTAQSFLEDLLGEYSRGLSFPAAFQSARQRLRLAPGGFAKFADWLPILFHNPLSQSVTWRDLSMTAFGNWIPPQLVTISNYLSQPKYRIWTTVGVSLAISALLLLQLQSTPLISTLENAIVDQFQSMQIDRLPLRSSQVTIVNYDPLILSGYISDDRELQQTIDLVKANAKPLGWGVNLGINDPAKFDPNVIQGCLESASTDRLQLNSCDRQFLNSILKVANLPELDDREFRLNINLLNKIDRLGTDSISTRSPAELKQLFDRKVILIGNFDGKELNSLTRQVIALDQIIRANNAEYRLPLYINSPMSQQFLWMFLWSIVTGISIWRRKWTILFLIIMADVIAVGGMLLFCGRELPLIITSIAIGLVASIVETMKIINKTRNIYNGDIVRMK